MERTDEMAASGMSTADEVVDGARAVCLPCVLTPIRAWRIVSAVPLQCLPPPSPLISNRVHFECNLPQQILEFPSPPLVALSALFSTLVGYTHDMDPDSTTPTTPIAPSDPSESVQHHQFQTAFLQHVATKMVVYRRTHGGGGRASLDRGSIRGPSYVCCCHN